MLDLGCGEEPYRDLFPDVETSIGLDVTIDAGDVDVVADAQLLPFADDSFDTVLSNQLLEHVPEPAILMSEAARVLRPDGCLLLTTPQTWGLHHEPHDYYRYTRYGLRYQAERAGLTVLSIEATCGMWATLAQRVADTVIFLYAARSPRWLVLALRAALVPVLMSGAALDRVFGRRGDTLDNLLVARKPRA